MSVATSTALTIGAIAAGAGTSLYAANKGSGAVKDASQTQAASADKAMALQQQMYQQQRTDLGPYRAAGQGAVGQLSYLLGVPGFESGPQGPSGLSKTGNPLMGANGDMLSPQAQVSKAAASFSGPGVPQGGGGTMIGGGGGGMVTLRAPDGSTKQFQAGDPALQHYAGLPGVQRVN